MSKRKTYTKAFKVEAVRLAKESGNVTGTARRLGLASSMLWRWKKQVEDDVEQAFPGQGTVRQGTPREAELSRLRRRLAQVEEENAILKKAVGIFTRGQL
jgi:transposase